MARITPDVPQRGAAQNLLQVVDTYYRPARDRMGEAAMSKGLRDTSNFLGNEAGKAKKEQLEEISLQAQQDAMQGLDPDVELSEVRKGLLFRSNSRAYNQTYNETMGKKAAIEFKEKASLDYEKSGLKYNTNPEKFREWMNERVHGFLKAPENQNPYFLAGAMPYVEQAAFNMGAAHTSNVSRQMERNHIAALQKQAADVVMGLTTGERNVDEVIDMMSGLNNQAYGTGLSGPTSRKALISSFLTVADATDNKDMISALLDAQQSGKLRLTPEEWNSVTEQGMAIERDINFRQAQRERAAEAQKKTEINSVSEAVTDFYIDPDNAGVTFPQFLSRPVGDSGKTMGEIIAASPNSTALMAKAKTAHETMNSVFEIGQAQESSNNAAIDDAYNNGQINNYADLQQWMMTARNDGYRFNDENIKFAYGKLENIKDPESVYNTQAHKDFASATRSRIIETFEGGNTNFATLGAQYVGGMTNDIKLRFNEYLAAEYAALPDGQSNSTQAIREAVARAEQATMDYYRENDPDVFEAARSRYEAAAEKGEITFTSNPAMLRETQSIMAEQKALEAEEMQRMQQNRVGNVMDNRFDRSDIELQQGMDILFGEEDQQDVTSSLTANPDREYILSQVAQSEAQQAARVAQQDAEDAAEKARVEAERQDKLDADSALIGEAAKVAESLNKMDLNEVSDDQIATMLSDIQKDFNLTLPTNYDELKFLAEDLTALQEETGVEINQEVLAKLLQAAMDRF